MAGDELQRASPDALLAHFWRRVLADGMLEPGFAAEALALPAEQVLAEEVVATGRAPLAVVVTRVSPASQTPTDVASLAFGSSL